MTSSHQMKDFKSTCLTWQRLIKMSRLGGWWVGTPSPPVASCKCVAKATLALSSPQNMVASFPLITCTWIPRDHLTSVNKKSVSISWDLQETRFRELLRAIQCQCCEGWGFVTLRFYIKPSFQQYFFFSTVYLNLKYSLLIPRSYCRMCEMKM